MHVSILLSFLSFSEFFCKVGPDATASRCAVSIIFFPNIIFGMSHNATQGRCVTSKGNGSKGDENFKISPQFFNQWEGKSKPIAPCWRDFSRALSRYLLWILILSSGYLLLVWLAITLLSFLRQSFENLSLNGLHVSDACCSSATVWK